MFHDAEDDLAAPEVLQENPFVAHQKSVKILLQNLLV